jgi:hypothetical protein
MAKSISISAVPLGARWWRNKSSKSHPFRV